MPVAFYTSLLLFHLIILFAYATLALSLMLPVTQMSINLYLIDSLMSYNLYFNWFTHELILEFYGWQGSIQISNHIHIISGLDWDTLPHNLCLCTGHESGLSSPSPIDNLFFHLQWVEGSIISNGWCPKVNHITPTSSPVTLIQHTFLLQTYSTNV